MFVMMFHDMFIIIITAISYYNTLLTNVMIKL